MLFRSSLGFAQKLQEGRSEAHLRCAPDAVNRTFALQGRLGGMAAPDQVARRRIRVDIPAGRGRLGGAFLASGSEGTDRSPFTRGQAPGTPVFTGGPWGPTRAFAPAPFLAAGPFFPIPGPAPTLHRSVPFGAGTPATEAGGGR